MRSPLIPWLAWLALGAPMGCIDGSNRELELGDGLLFVLVLSQQSGEFIEAHGPFDRTSANTLALTAKDGEALLLLEIDEDELAERQPIYRREARTETMVVRASTDLSSCGAEGRILEETQIELPLDPGTLGEDVLTLARLHPRGAGGADEAPSLPPGLALRLPVATCGARTHIELRPFAREADVYSSTGTQGHGRFQAMVALDEDNLVLVAEQGLLWVRRGDVVASPADVLPALRLVEHQNSDFRWIPTHAAQLSGDWPREPAILLVSLMAVVSDESDRGAGWVRLQLDPVSGWSILDRETRPAAGLAGRAALWHVYVDETGRAFLTGREWVATTTSPDARPALEGLPKFFSGRVTVKLDAPGAPHLMLMDDGQAFEGDVFEGDLTTGPYRFTDTVELEFGGAARMMDPSETWVATGSDQRLWQRPAPGDWSHRPYSLPAAAGTCADRESSCGRQPSIGNLGPITSSPVDGGLLFGSRRCNAIFWLRPREVCVGVTGLPGREIRVGNLSGLRVLVTHGDRVFAAEGERFVYELELEVR